MLDEIMEQIPKKKRNVFYVLYKGDQIICTGTMAEIHTKTQTSIATLNWLTTPSAAKRERKSKRDRLIMIQG